MRTVLVTGAAGFIGSHTVDRLIADGGWNVIALDNLDAQVHGEGCKSPKNLAAHLEKKTIEWVHGDVRDRAVLEKHVPRADAILHLAAAVGVGQSMYKPHYYCDVNMGGTGLVLDVLANTKHAVRKLVVASSMSLYGEGAYENARGQSVFPMERTFDAQRREHVWEHLDPTDGSVLKALPTPESKPLHSTSIYAISKKVQEEMAVCFGHAYKLPVVALRYFNVYGPRQSLNNPYTGAAAIFLSRFLNGQAPLVFEDGLQSRDFINVRDIARANVAALASAREGQAIYNVGTGKATTILDVARTLGRGLGISIEPQVAQQFRAGDIRHCYSDPSRIQADLGWKAGIERDEGFADLINESRNEKPVDLFAKSMNELNARQLVQ